MSDESRDPKPATGISRRRFVTLVAAGSAAVLANSAGAVAPKGRRAGGAAPGATRPARAMSAVTSKELARQRGATVETLKAIRGHAMPPGTELGFVFRATRPAKKER